MSQNSSIECKYSVVNIYLYETLILLTCLLNTWSIGFQNDVRILFSIPNPRFLHSNMALQVNKLPATTLLDGSMLEISCQIEWLHFQQHRATGLSGSKTWFLELVEPYIILGWSSYFSAAMCLRHVRNLHLKYYVIVTYTTKSLKILDDWCKCFLYLYIALIYMRQLWWSENIILYQCMCWNYPLGALAC